MKIVFCSRWLFADGIVLPRFVLAHFSPPTDSNNAFEPRMYLRYTPRVCSWQGISTENEMHDSLSSLSHCSRPAREHSQIAFIARNWLTSACVHPTALLHTCHVSLRRAFDSAPCFAQKPRTISTHSLSRSCSVFRTHIEADVAEVTGVIDAIVACHFHMRNVEEINLEGRHVHFERSQ